MVRIPPLKDQKEDRKVTESILNGKRILAVDDELDVLDVLREELLAACPDCQIDKATTYETAKELLNSWRYDIVILDIMGVRGFDLLDLAVKHKFPVAMLTAHALSPEALKKSIDFGARAYLPKEKLGEIVPFLEDILEYDAPAGWNRLFGKLGGFFDDRFGPNWRKSDDRFGGDFNGKIEGQHDRVIIK
jgi:CheY-like chemotaxis protein